jgi:hypothetical protein
MESASFLKMKDLSCNIVNRKIDNNGKKVEWLKIRWIRFVKSNPFEMLFKYSVTESEFHAVNLRKRGRSNMKVIQSLPQLYPLGRQITVAKYKDIQYLLKYILPVHHSFHESLPHHSRDAADVEASDDIVDDDSDALVD